MLAQLLLSIHSRVGQLSPGGARSAPAAADLAACYACTAQGMQQVAATSALVAKYRGGVHDTARAVTWAAGGGGFSEFGVLVSEDCRSLLGCTIKSP